MFPARVCLPFLCRFLPFSHFLFLLSPRFSFDFFFYCQKSNEFSYLVKWRIMTSIIS